MQCIVDCVCDAWKSCEVAAPAAEFKSLNFQLLFLEDEMQELLLSDGTDTASTKISIKFRIRVAKFETFLRQKQLELSWLGDVSEIAAQGQA